MTESDDLQALARWVANTVDSALVHARQLFQRRHAQRGEVTTKGHHADLVSRADTEVEVRLVAEIARRRPLDAIHSEELGRSGATDARHVWVVDPLDGTSNFVHGIPLYGVALSLYDDGAPVLAVSRSTLDDVPLTTVAPPRPDPDTAVRSDLAVSLVKPYSAVGQDDAWATRRRLERHVRRVLDTWAPTADLSLLVAGDIDAIVTLGALGTEMHAVHPLAAHHGHPTFDLRGKVIPPQPTPQTTLIARHDIAEELLRVLHTAAR